MAVKTTITTTKKIIADTFSELVEELGDIDSLEKVSISNSKLSSNKYFASMEIDNLPPNLPSEVKLQDKTLTENGVYTADSGYNGFNEITVNVPEVIREVEVPVEVEIPVQPTLQNKTITENGEYIADEGYDGFGNISVNVIPSEEAYTDYLRWKQYHFISYTGPETLEEGEVYEGTKVTIVVTPERGKKIELKAFSGSIQWGDGSYIEHIEDYATEDQLQGSMTSWPYKFMSLSHTFNPGTYDIYFSKDFCQVKYANDSNPNAGSYDLRGVTNWGNIPVKSVSGEVIKDLHFNTAGNFYSTEMAIPYGTKEIEDLTFASTFGLLKVYLPTTLQVIGYGAFKNSELTSIEIPVNGNLTEIGEYAFQNCALSNLTIPPSITEIGYNAFTNVKSLKIMHNSPNKFNVTLFGNKLEAIYVPYSADHSVLNAYKTAGGWSNYANIIFESDPE